MSKYYYKHKGIRLKEMCPYKTYHVMIGSSTCSNCENNISINSKQHWVICRKINLDERKKILKRLVEDE